VGSGATIEGPHGIEDRPLYLDDQDRVILIEDNFHLIETAQKHYVKVGLGADFVKQFIR